MPDQLQPGLNIKDYEKWVRENVNNPLITLTDNNVNHVPQRKGIYFWFMLPDGYQVLSKNLPNNLQPVQPLIELDNYHLIYIGTAGTGKDGNGHLRQRLECHIAQKHLRSAVCSGALSTFRTGISSLISDDLILYPGSSTETEVNNIFSRYLKVFWMEYQDDQDAQIDNDETILINNLKPLFNIRNNPNQNNQYYPTYLYRERRQRVIQRTKQRLNCNAGDNNPQNNRRRTNEAKIEFKGHTYTLSTEQAERLSKMKMTSPY